MRHSIFIFLLVIFVSCNSESNQNTIVAPVSTKTIIAKSPALLIITEDRSGSTGAIRKLNTEDYAALFHAFANTHYGTIAVRVIGNPIANDRAFYRLEIPAPKPLNPINSELNIDIKAKLTQENKKIDADNNLLTTSIHNQIQDFITNTIQPKIIQYHPDGKDLTNIQDAFDHLNTFLNEPSINEFVDRKIVFLSDGIHDYSKLGRTLHFDNSKITTYTVGWKDISVFEVKPEVFESPEALIHYLTK